METIVLAPNAGKISKIGLPDGTLVEAEDFMRPVARINEIQKNTQLAFKFCVSFILIVLTNNKLTPLLKNETALTLVEAEDFIVEIS